MSRSRRFISFTDKELEIMQNSIESKDLQREIADEFRNRERCRREHEEWLARNKPSAIVC